MKVKFNGITEKRRSGCGCKGKTSKEVLVTRKSLFLPSGATKTFRVGRVEEIPDIDAEYLLEYTFVDSHGKTRQSFEVVP